jgi:4-diphosphocytidyl-2-C-methyl-D-erythritol kinase
MPAERESMRALYDVPAPAKLNLHLHVVGRRADGYHLLDSLMVLIDWADSLHFELRDDGGLARRDLGDAMPADDLCLRAARALQSASGTSLGADITLDKRVPVGAGMGGGSSDAASTLLALNRLWRLDWPVGELLPIGLGLGADVPFFLAGSNARVRGIGERLSPVLLEPAWFAVVKPAGSLETRAVFASRRVAERIEAARIAGFSEGGLEGGLTIGLNSGPELAEGDGRNDLQAAAEDLCPDVASAAALLHETYGNSRMTGSGSAVFARAGKAGPGSAPTAAMPHGWPAGWSSRMCRSLERHPLAAWVRHE